MKTKVSGIYCIENLITGKVYIGQADHIKRRWQNHKRTLKNNKHKNIHLQNSWNKHGKGEGGKDSAGAGISTGRQ